jgi:hypothetical protein
MVFFMTGPDDKFVNMAAGGFARPALTKSPRKGNGTVGPGSPAHPGRERALIFSASRRTDIPAFFGGWFLERLRRCDLAARNPVNSRQITHFKFNPADVECIVFWTKNPAPFMNCLDELDARGYNYYFQFTLTPYGHDIEQNIDKGNIIDTFIRLSERIGGARVIWRYDPIIINDRYSVDFHVDRFCEMARQLCGYTEKCVISFIDEYRFLSDVMRRHSIGEVSPPLIEAFVGQICPVVNALPSTITLATCCEKIDLAAYGVRHNACVDGELVARITGVQRKYRKDPSQRPLCGCVQSRDIGTYGTCRHNCVYCYAGRGTTRAVCDEESPLLCDTIDTVNDTVKIVDLRRE